MNQLQVAGVNRYTGFLICFSDCRVRYCFAGIYMTRRHVVPASHPACILSLVQQYFIVLQYRNYYGLVGGTTVAHLSLGKGYCRQNSFTSFLNLLSTLSSLRPAMAFCIHSANSTMSFSFNPLVVIAGVPSLMPLGLNGGKLSFGIEFLFKLSPILSSAFSASPPSISKLVLTSAKIRWLSVPL